MKTFDPHALRQHLTDKHLSVASCARALNTPVTSVSGWINGRHRPSWGNVQRLARLLDCPPDALMTEVTTFTPGETGAVGLSEAQALILAVAVALVNAAEPEALAADWWQQLKPAEQEAVRLCLVLTPQWSWAWQKLRRLGTGDHPLKHHGLQLRITPPPATRRRLS